MARALRFQSDVPLKFWGECVLSAVHIINRLPSVVLQGKSTYEVFFGKSPSLDHLRIFGYLCYIVNVKRHDRFSPRGIPVAFLGYSSTRKVYKVYDLKSNHVTVSRDVVFKEDLFPFKQMKKALRFFTLCFGFC